MSIIKFRCEWEAKLFIKSNSFKLVGSGSEGTCYKGKDKKVYKILRKEKQIPYKAEKIITDEDIKLDSFAFPEELYTVEDELIGYRTEYVPKDYFSIDNTFDLENIADLDFEGLSAAYKDMLEDIKLLSEEHIIVFDLPLNLMFDGEKLTAIDTCGYRKVKNNPYEDNLKSFNRAIEIIFNMWFMNHKELKYKIEGTDIDSYLQQIIKSLPKDIYLQRIIKTMEKDVKGKQ